MISIIIPACNEEKYIENTLESISNQNYKKYEIIVVCNGCTDKTFDKVKKKADKVLNFPWRNIAKARNKGVKVSKYEKLLFLDADTNLVGDVLKKIVENNYQIGTCRFKPDNNKLKHLIFYYFKSRFFSPILKISNGILFLNKNIFLGFNDTLKKGEEGDLIRNTLKNEKIKFTVLDSYVESSTRRYDSMGYWNVVKYWIKEKIKPSDEEYSVIR